MNFILTYKTTEKISPQLQAEINQHLANLTNKRVWLHCEEPCLWNSDGLMLGQSQLNLTPDWLAIGLEPSVKPKGTVLDLLEAIADVSRHFDVGWEVFDNYSLLPLGLIDVGRCDENLQRYCEILAGTRDLLPDDLSKDPW